MNILVIGKGGREHAIAKACKESKLVKKVFVAPGNHGMSDIATIIDIDLNDKKGFIDFALNNNIDLTIVGPDDILASGIVDEFQKNNLKIFGPTASAAKIESSKDYAKSLMTKYNIPTAKYQTFNNYDDAINYVLKMGLPIVIKEDGLKLGKGVTVALKFEEADKALKNAFIHSDNKVVIEEYLEGFEFSLIALCYHDIVIPFDIAQDHKRAFDNDLGPNTGGMGAYSPVNKISKEIIDEALTKIMIPTAKALVLEGNPFVGFLFGGLMVTKDGVKTIEFNARFGDPEAEVILPRLKSDFVKSILDIMNKEYFNIEFHDFKTVGVVLASKGYPETSTKGALIKGINNIESTVYHMGTKYENENYYTNGGRVLIVVSKGVTLEEAYDKAYLEVKKIDSDSLFYRTDIAKKDMI